MSDDDELLAMLSGMKDDTTEDSGTPAVLETPAAEETPAEVKTEDEDPLAGLLVGENSEEEPPAPVKKPRGRPKGSTKAKTAAKKVEEKVAEEISEPVVEAEKSTEPVDEASTDVVSGETDENTLADGATRDIYILSDAQILNGHTYRLGQKITFTVGDKFYNSQFDRDGKNWLDHIDDPAYQYAHFGRLIVRADSWDGVPFGSTEGINNPALALAIAKIAQEEHERNGRPFN